MGDKECSKCSETKEYTEFHKQVSSKDGFRPTCKDCRKLKYNSNRAQVIARVQKYYEKNKDRIRERTKEWYNNRKVFGVYKAYYPSGIYIGSGNLTCRINNHLSGNSRIAKTLQERALRVDTLLLCGEQECLNNENKYIEESGMNTLLNKQYFGSGGSRAR